MKKILSILSTISLSTIITTNVIACNESKTYKSEFIPQQPPKNSNGKLVNNMLNEKNILINKNIFEDVIVQNGKHYFVIFRLKGNEVPGKIYKLQIGKPNNMPIYSDNLKDLKAFYRGDGNNEPLIPTINENNGEITNGNEKIETK